MVNSGINWRSCDEVFAIDEMRPAPKKPDLRDPAVKGPFTCPNCNSRHEYTSNDIRFYGGDVRGKAPTRD